MTILRTKNAEMAIKLLALSYAYDTPVKLTHKQIADLLSWIKEIDSFGE
jgi:hypothetical protein